MKTAYSIIKLHFTSPLHLSKGKTDYDVSATTIHSDTIKSAIFACAMDLFNAGNESENEALFHAFQVSSAFPFYQETLFLPKALNDQHLFEAVEDEDYKQVRKIQYFSSSVFEQIAAGKKLRYDAAQHPHASAYYGETELPNSLFKQELRQRVSIPRMRTTDATPFYMDKIYFQEGAGLYFILDIKEESWRSKIQAALHLLGENGLGTDRNIGQGQFIHSKSQLQLNLPEKASGLFSLSLFCPKNQENLPALANSFYKLIKRGGWIANPVDENNLGLRKKSVYMFAEGSVFPAHQGYEGKVVDLKPNILKNAHAIWRDGTPLFIPIQLNPQAS